MKALVSSTKDANVFALVDAIMERRTSAALSAMRQLLDEGAAGPYLLTMVARQARMVALAQELLARRAPQQEWAARLGTSSDFVVRKTMEQARRFPSGCGARSLPSAAGDRPRAEERHVRRARAHGDARGRVGAARRRPYAGR